MHDARAACLLSAIVQLPLASLAGNTDICNWGTLKMPLDSWPLSLHRSVLRAYALPLTWPIHFGKSRPQIDPAMLVLDCAIVVGTKLKMRMAPRRSNVAKTHNTSATMARRSASVALLLLAGVSRGQEQASMCTISA